MADDSIQRFLQADTSGRLRLVEESDHAPALRRYLGDPAFEQYAELAREVGPDRAHLGAQVAPNLVFVPGVMGSLLGSRSLGGVWWLDLRDLKRIDALRLADDGKSDATPDHQIAPLTNDLYCEGFLAAALRRDDFGHVVFPYDWRKPLTAGTAALRDRVLELHANNGGRPVHLVGHSMGGLLIRATLMRHGDVLWPKLGRVAFIATPHYGSPAIAGYLKNHLWGFELLALLGAYLSRATFRTLWGVLSLLPAPRGIYPGTRPTDPLRWRSDDPGDPYVHPCTNFDLYLATNWDLGLNDQDAARLQTVLDAAASLHKSLDQAHDRLPQDARDRMLVIAGVGYSTLFRVAYRDHLLGLWEHMQKITDRVEGDPHRDGDGRVPLASAELENVGATRYVKGIHNGLPNIYPVHEDVFRWLNDEELELPKTAADALATHLAAPAQTRTDHLDGTVRAVARDDPGYLQLEPPPSERLNELRIRLENQQLPEFLTVRLL